MMALRPSTQIPESASMQMYSMLNAHFLVQSLHVAATMRIADLLVDGPQTVEELAQASEAHAPSLYRLLRMLASVDVFNEDAQGRFRLTPLAATLCSGTPDSVRDWALFIASPPVWAGWGDLLHSIRTGESAFEHANGSLLFQYMTDNPDLGRSYSSWMVRQSELQNASVLASYDFSAHRRIVDIGGGQGATLFSILETHPKLRGVLYDLPEVVTNAVLPKALAARCEIMDGNMMLSVPACGDAYVLKRVLMDWTDEMATRVLINCRTVMEPEGRILVIETVVPKDNEPSVSKFLDIAMLALQHGGRVRTEMEHRKLFEAAGLVLTQVVPTQSPLFVLVGVRSL